MSLADEINWRLSGSRDNTPPGLGELLDDFERRAGSGRKAAAALGIGKSSWQRWKAGQTKTLKGPKLDNLLRGWRRQQLKSDAAVQWRQDQMSVTVVGAALGGTGTRTITARQLKLVPGTGSKVIERWLAGDPDGAARAFVRGIGDTWYRTVMFGAWLDDPAAAKRPATGGTSAGGGGGGSSSSTSSGGGDDEDDYDEGEFHDDDDLAYEGVTADEDPDYAVGVVGVS